MSSGHSFEQCPVVLSGTLAVGIIRHRRAFGAPPAYALAQRIDQRYGVARSRAVCRPDDFAHEVNKLIDVSRALSDQILPEFQIAATGAPTLLHQLHQRRAIQVLFLLAQKV